MGLTYAKPFTEADIPDLTGKLVVVTGANSGLGLESARQFMAHGANVILACRNLSKAETVVKQLEAAGYPGEVSTLELDLSDLDNVAKSAEELKKRVDRIDILLLNAGVMMPPRSDSKQGYELTFAVNHLGHYAFTLPLLPLLKNTPGSRVSVVTSSMMRASNTIDFDDVLERKKGYTLGSLAYAESKIANVLFARKLQQLLDASGEGSPLVTLSHPGYTNTNLQRHFTLGSLSNYIFAMEIPQGALSQIRASVEPNPPKYSMYSPDGMYCMRGYPDLEVLPSYCQDDTLADTLWALSEKLSGVKFRL